MIKRFLLTVLLLLTLPVFAVGEFESALQSGANVFLYIYTQDCSHCKNFEAKYNKLTKEFNGKYIFVKVDGDTPYGRVLMTNFRVGFVPFVLLVNSKKQIISNINPVCLSDIACTQKEMKAFRK